MSSALTTFLALPLKSIVESPKNPRKHFNEARLAELVDSIRQHGVMEPIVVRPADRHGSSVYELAAGHRRTRAARLAGVSELPAIVKVMTDAEFLEMLTISNLQREDVSPIEEAEGYRTLLVDGGYDVPSLALKLGKSESYVYGRLKLLELAPAVREALARELIGLAQAVELGKVDAATQDETLRTLFNLDPKKLTAASAPDETTDDVEADGFDDDAPDIDDEDFGETVTRGADATVLSRLRSDVQREKAFTLKEFLSVNRVTPAELRAHFAEHVYVQLSRAPFEVTDATLVPTAGSCVTCPKRTGATASLFPELAGEDMCLDRVCFHAKGLAQIDRVVDAEQARHPDIDVVKISTQYTKQPKGVLKAGLYKPAGPVASDRPTKKARIGVYIDGVARGTAIWIKADDELIEKATAGRAVTAVAPATNTHRALDHRDFDAERKLRAKRTDAWEQALVSAVMEAVRGEPLGPLDALRAIARMFVQTTTEWLYESDLSAHPVVTALGVELGTKRGRDRLKPLVDAIATADALTLEQVAIYGAVDAIEGGWRNWGDKPAVSDAAASIANAYLVDAIGVVKSADQQLLREIKAAEKAKEKVTETKTAKAKKPAAKAAKPVARSGSSKSFYQPLQPSAALGIIVGFKPLPRTEVVKKVWAYIKRQKLLDKANKRLINADDSLRAVFGKDQVSMFDMTKILASHLTPIASEPAAAAKEKTTTKATKRAKAVQ